MPCMCREKQAPDRENGKEIHYDVLSKMRCGTLYRPVFSSVPHKTELLGVKETIDLQGQCRKNLISVQCVNCSGRLVTINFVISTSEFELVVSDSKYT
jgi:hypothetical protein